MMIKDRFQNEGNDVKTVGVAIDNQLHFDNLYFASICLKLNKRLSALGRLAKLLSFNKNYSFLKLIFTSVTTNIFLFSFITFITLNIFLFS